MNSADKDGAETEGIPAVMVIAEAGVNHNGDLDRAIELVDAAAESGADVVKFQTFLAEEEISRDAPKAAYQLMATEVGESQFEMVKNLELSPTAHEALIDKCRRKNIRFLSSPFDIPSILLLADRLGLKTLKIPSGEMTHAPFLFEAARTGCDLIVSTGMSTLDEIRDALSIITLGFTHSDGKPSLEAARDVYGDGKNQDVLRKKVSLLQCTTEYPAPFEDANLKAMDTLREMFGLAVGYSDHTPDTVIAIAAAARGACIIEKHLTLDRRLPGPDHKASLEPDPFARMVKSIRAVEQALGDGLKKPAPSEQHNIPIARKSLVAKRPIKAGDLFTPETLAVKRPGTGISPMEYWRLLDKPSRRHYALDEIVHLDEINDAE